MKKLFTIILLMPVFLIAQVSEQWQQVYGGAGVEEGFSVKSCLGQGYVVAGVNSTVGVSDGYLVRTDSLGLVMWSRLYGGTNIDVFRSIKLMPDSGFIIAGYTNSYGQGGYDGWVLRLNKMGDTLWTRVIGTSNWDFFYDVTTTWDSGFVCVGGTYGSGNGDEDLFIAKLDSNGNVVWMETYGGVNQDEGRSVIEASDSSLITCGFTYSMGDTTGDARILKIDGSDGDTIWTRTLNHPQFADKAWGVARLDAFGGFLIVGETSVNGDPDAFLMAMNNDSTILFNYIFGGAGSYDYFASAVARPNGTFAALGYTTNPLGNGNGDLYFFHTRNGWFNTGFGTLEPETGNSLDLAQDDGYIACGSTEGFNSFQPNLYLIKIDTLGLTSNILSIDEKSSSLNGSVTCFPNPADDKIAMNVISPNGFSGNVRIRIFDETGSLVMEDADQWTFSNANEASIQLNTASLTNGIYFYSIDDDSSHKAEGRFIIAR